MINEFTINDQIIGVIKHSDPDSVPIKIRLTDDHIFLYVGPRDWQWDRKDGHLVGSGTGICGAGVYVETVLERLQEKAN